MSSREPSMGKEPSMPDGDTQTLQAVYEPEFTYLNRAIVTAEAIMRNTGEARKRSVEADNAAREHVASLQRRLDDLMALAKRDGVELK